MYIEQKIVNLDTVANTWMRAPGESIGTFALESALDELAYELADGSRGTAPHQSSLRRIPPSTRTSLARHLTEAYRQGSETFGWNSRNREPRSQRDGKWLVGQGVATAYYPYLPVPCDGAHRSRCGRTRHHFRPLPRRWAWERRPSNCSTLPTAWVCRYTVLPFTTVTPNCRTHPLWQAARIRLRPSSLVCRPRWTELHHELLQLAQERSIPSCWSQSEQVIARNGGLYLAEEGRGETYIEILRKAGKGSLEVEKQSVRPWR